MHRRMRRVGKVSLQWRRKKRTPRLAREYCDRQRSLSVCIKPTALVQLYGVAVDNEVKTAND
jgi:hypothetical protein